MPLGLTAASHAMAAPRVIAAIVNVSQTLIMITFVPRIAHLHKLV
jgi:hypothetical protein